MLSEAGNRIQRRAAERVTGLEDLLKRCVFLIGRQRSGTTVLRRSLASHPQVHDLGEIMHPAHQNGFYSQLCKRLNQDLPQGAHNKWLQILTETLQQVSKNDPPSQRYIIDLKYNMTLSFGTTFKGGRPENALLQHLAAKNARVIQIIRRNKLKLLVSERVALKTNQWELSAGAGEKKKVEVFISPVTLGLKLQQEMAQDTYFLEQTQTMKNKLTLVYEDMFTEDGSFRPRIFTDISKMLRIDSKGFDLQPQLSKQRDKMSETISNFPQVRGALQTLVKEGEIPAYYVDSLD
ncbi:sulfotransferase [Antarcticimicrobium luteum]|uniref:Sulfotransferase n=1 Tax=Antarcticimicrobium luteum TaxID=2547397 RepID=A0A4R5VEU1_9RHOB|nr:sulfotransferase [Antarcticimicrobium luteum]TDK50907.1 hypothetical protein E1832_05020 [Antarcticimicrobium luteum]